MNIRQYRYLAAPSAIAVGAGLTSGLLYSLMSQGTLLAAGLACLAPLPIMIAMLGFGRMVGIASLASACLAVAILVPAVAPRVVDISTFDTIVRAASSFTVMLGAPALWLSYLASMSRSRGQDKWQVAAPSTTTYLREYASVERLVTACVAISATVVVLGIIVIVLRHGSLEQAIDRIASELAPVLEDMLSGNVKFPEGYDPQRMARMMVLAAAPVSAGMLFMVLMVDLWLAGKATQLSGRLYRPWPDVAREFLVPRPYGLLLGVAFSTTFFGGAAALIASVVAAVLTTAFAFQGLAVVHVVSSGWKVRILGLWILYGAVFFLMPTSLFLLAVLGLVESLYSFRNRRAAEPPKN